MPRGVNKENLPSKLCEVCKRPFSWRKVWERCWDDVKTCSDRCKAERKKQNKAKKEEPASPGTSTTPTATGNADQMAKTETGAAWQEARLQIPAHPFLLFSLCPHRFMAVHKMQCP